MPTSLGERALKGVAAGIGLVSESITAHKTKKQNQAGQSSSRGASSEEDELSSPDREQNKEIAEESVTALEEQWILDEAQEELRDSEDQESPLGYTEMDEGADDAGLARQFADSHPAPPPYTLSEIVPQPRLSAPVLLPQRRPKNRDRGFIRAYAPALAECGIDQKTFLDFLDTAEKGCRAAPWLRAINLASIGTMWMPTVTGMAVSIAIQIATDVAIAVDGRRNSFFDQINKDFFQPRGLFCLVMTWNPELADSPCTTINLNSMISQAADRESGRLGRLQKKFKSSDGKAYGNIFPEVAPLIFPDIDQLACDKDAKKKLSGLKKKGRFVGKYMDKRAQAKFIYENPDSHLSQVPMPTFTSRYANPNHAASSGDPIALVTGGKFTREKLSDMKGRGPRRILTERFSSYDSQSDSPRDTGSNSSSNPPAPYGRSFGLKDAINQVKDIRRSGSFTQSSPRGSRDEGRDFDLQRLRAAKNNVGLLTPITKLLKKVCLFYI
ncbi:uncharacterized protein N7483_006409 [Penicillium malachiteum]|uniref:uncharacterized protein n=1 Tax=Penicillium malachiteum TaxID=1324776 RepID=UPI00254872C7|nr:uncharacterized protein N7483_006409 [Penicillium malachiteum]KAJ5725052.1 hypothetical protein N7483_006409 [Penicillium malachiteum]